MPLDVRKVFDLPAGLHEVWGYARAVQGPGGAPVREGFFGRSETFRTSGGKAAADVTTLFCVNLKGEIIWTSGLY
jgi:hypothetical protein